MNIVIAGMGEVGLHVARVLSSDGHDITVIDTETGAIERAEETIDALTLRGPADCPRILREARVADCELFAALTGSGSVNLIGGMMARELGAQHVVARVREAHYFETADGVYPGYMGLDLVVNEEAVVANELARLVRARSATAIASFADHRLEAVELPIDEDAPGTNTPVGDLELPDGVQLAAILHRDTVLVPNAADMVHVGDAVVCVGPPAGINEVETVFARQRRLYNKRTVIVGGGGVGANVAQGLDDEGTEVVVIERNRAACDELSRTLRSAQVLLGDGTDLHLLEEAGVTRADVFCAVSNHDEVNLMAALLARDHGVRRCVTLVHKPDYVTVCRHLGLENTVSPRLLVAREIIRQLRGGLVVNSVDMLGGAGRVVEVRIRPGAPIAGHALRELVVPRGALICAHSRGGHVRPPSGDVTLQPEDRLVFFVKTDSIRSLEKLLGGRLSQS